MRAEILQQFRRDPLIASSTLFGSRLWTKQQEVLRSVWENKYTAVKSGNSVGKSRIAAETALCFLASFCPSKVVTTGPTFLQVEEILWKEIAGLYNNAKIPIGGELLKTELKLSDDWFAIGISTNEVNRFQGIHSPNLLVIIDEALGVASEIWEATDGLHPARVLAIGNPLDAVGNFYNCFSSSLWHKITISCEDCVKWQEENGAIPGLVTRDWIEERAGEWGRGSPLYQSRVLGEFPEETASTLISRTWIDRARRGVDLDGQQINDQEEDSLRVTGADVATKHGDCETVIGYRYGHTLASIQGFYRIPTTETAERLQRMRLIHRAEAPVVDSDGVGEGIADMLIHRNIGCIEFHGGYGQKAMDANKFRNLRSQFYWIVAKKFEKGMYDLSKIPAKEFEILKNQLSAIRLKNSDAMGRIQIETKEDLMARGIKSPDYADCFVYMEYGYWMGRNSEIREFCYR